MKHLLFLNLLLICSLVMFGQTKRNFASIDARSKSIGYLPLEELVRKLVSPYPDEEDKTRAIFSWIAFHISYDYRELKNSDPLRYDKYKYGNVKPESVLDSLWNAEYASFALKNHRAICGEYAALFKAMCDVAHIKCEVIKGYAKWDENIGDPFESNHAWNAVFLKEHWQLMDVTWGAGYLDPKGGKQVSHFNPFYFCTPPELMINSHYPGLLKWALTDPVITRDQFQKAIYYNYDGESKIRVENVIPKVGFLKKRVGDSISFEMTTNIKPEIIGLTFNDTIEEVNYEPLPQINKGLEEMPRAKTGSVKPVSKKEAHAIHDLFMYVDTASVDNLAPPKAKASKVGAIASVKTNTIDQNKNEFAHYFTTDDNKASFKYYIKKKGDYLIWISINYKNIMAYRLIAE